MTTATTPLAEVIRNAFPFTIQKRPLVDMDAHPTPHYGLFRTDTQRTVGPAVSKRYTPHTLDDVVALADAAAAAIGSPIKVRCDWNAGHYVTIQPEDGWERDAKTGAPIVDVENPDTIAPQLIVSAGYDARPFCAQFGIWRLICSNGMIIPLPGADPVKRTLRHTARLRDEMPALIDEMASLISLWDGTVASIRRMSETNVNLEAWLDAIVGTPSDSATARSSRMIDKRRTEIRLRIVRERSRLNPTEPAHALDCIPVWQALQGTQGYLQHDATRRNLPSDHREAAFSRFLSAQRDTTYTDAVNLANDMTSDTPSDRAAALILA